MPNGAVDERVVEMRLDNQNFESGAKKTISTLEKLEQALHLKGSSKGIDDVQSSVNKFDTNNMTSGLQKVQASFSALEVVGMRVISNLTDSVYNFATKTIKEFTVDPIAHGWEKFGDKTTAVATLTAQGYELEKVNKLMDDLNWFTDETSYNFTDMVSNIAKFTATGQDLDSSVTAMEGIALWAALSGQNATKASMAMYQLSQAMSKGALKYDDYKSIQNASMDTQEFRQQAVAAAEAMGVLEEDTEGFFKVVGTNKKFTFNELFTSDALSRTQWFSSDVMMDVFNKYSKAASEIQRYIAEHDDIDLAKEAMEALEEEARSLIETTEKQTGEVISMDEAYRRLGYDIDEFSMKAFKAGQQARTWKDVVDAIKDAVSTGWMNTFESLFGDAEAATAFYSDLVEHLYTVFAGGGEIRNSILDVAMGKRGKGWLDFTEKVESAGFSMEQLKDSYNEVISNMEDTDLPIINDINDLELAFKDGAFSGELLTQVIQNLTDQSEESSVAVEKVTKNIGDNMAELREVAKKMYHGELGIGDEMLGNLANYGFDYKMTKWVASNQHLMPWLSDAEMMKLMKMYHPEWLDDFLKNAGKTEAEIQEINALLDDVDSLWIQIAEDFGLVSDKAGGALFREGLLNISGGLADFVEALRSGFMDAFGGEDAYVNNLAESVYNAMERFHSFTEELKLSDDALEGIRNISASVVRVFRIFTTLGRGGFSLLGSAIIFVKDTIDSILSLFAKGDWKINDILDILQERLASLIPTTEDVKNGIKSLGERIFDLLPSEERLISFFTDLWEKIKNLPKTMREVFTLEGLKKFLPNMESLTEIWKTFTGLVWEKYPRIAQWLHDLNAFSALKGIFKGVSSSFGNIVNWVQELLGTKIDLSGFFDSFKLVGNTLTDLFTSLFGDKDQIKASVNNTITAITEILQERFSKMSLGDVFKVIKDAAGIIFFSRLIAIFHNLSEGIEDISWAIERLIRFKLGKVLGGLAQNLRAGAYLKLAGAILALAIAIKLLASVPEDKLANVAVTLGLLFLVLGHILKSIPQGLFNGSGNKIFNFKVFGTLSSALLAVAGLLGTLAILLAIAKKMDTTKMIAVFAGVAAIIAIFGFMMYNLSKQRFGKNPKNMFISFVGFALALQMLLPVLIAVAFMTDNAALRSVMSIIGLMAALGILAAATDKFVKSGAKLQRVSKAMIGMSVAISLLAPMLITLAIIPADVFGRAYASLLGLMAVMLGFTWAISKIKVNGNNFLKVAGAMVLLAAALRILMPVIRGFALLITMMAIAIPWETFTERLAAFQQALYPFATLATILMGMGVGLFAMGAGILSFALSLLVANLALLAFSAALLLIVKAIEKFGDAFPKLIEGISKAGSMITKENAKDIWRGAAAFGALAVVVGVLAFALSRLFRLGNISRRAGALGEGLVRGIGTAIGAAGKKIKEMLSDENFREALIASLSAMLIAVGLAAIGVLPTLVELGVNAFITFFSSLADSLVAHEEEIASAVSRIMVVLAKVISDAIKKTFTGIFSKDTDWLTKGIFIGGAVLLVGKLFGALKAIGSIAGAGGILAQAATTISTLGEHIGILIASLGGAGVVATFAGILAGLGFAIVETHKQTEQFIGEASEGLTDSVEDTVTMVKNLQDAQQEAQDKFDTAAQYTENLTLEQEELDARTVALNKGYEILAEKLGITTQELKDQMAAADGDIEKIKALQEVLEESKPTDANVPKNSYGPVKEPTDVNVPKKSYGPVKEVPKETVSEQVVEVTADTSSADTTLNEFWGDLKDSASEAGENVSTAIGRPVEGMWNRIASPDGVSDKVTLTASQMKDKLIEYFNSSMGDSGFDWSQMFEGMSDVDITQYFSMFKDQMGGFGDEIGGALPEGMQSGVDANADLPVSSVSTMDAAVESQARGDLGVNSPSLVFTEIGSGIPEGLRDGINNSSGEAISAVSNLASSIKEAFGNVDGSGSAIDWSSFLGDTSTLDITPMINTITSAVPQVQTASQAIGQAIANGIASEQSNINNVIIVAVSSANQTAFTLGAQYAQGFANGIYSKIGVVSRAASAMAKNAERSITVTIDAHSPSKVTTRLGSYFGQGFVNGINSQIKNVVSASSDLAYSATHSIESVGNSMQSAMSRAMVMVAEIANSDFEISPTITPVVDMSNINIAANYMNSMFSSTYSGSLSARASSISLDVREIQNGRNAAFAAQSASTNNSSNVNNLYIDGIKYNTDDYVDSSINNFVETMLRKQKMYA